MHTMAITVTVLWKTQMLLDWKVKGGETGPRGGPGRKGFTDASQVVGCAAEWTTVPFAGSDGGGGGADWDGEKISS